MNFINLNKKQIETLVDFDYITEEQLINATEVRLDLDEDSWAWVNRLEIRYEDGSRLGMYLNFHIDNGFSYSIFLKTK